MSAGTNEVAKALHALPARLRSTFPQMANVEDLCREIESLESKSAGTNGNGAAATFRDVARRRLEAAAGSGARLSNVLTPLLPQGDLLVFTLSKSGTVSQVLEDLLAEGRKLNVLVAESRPGAEGARMARELAEKGIRTRACDDLLLLSLVPPEAAPRRPAGYTGHAVVLVGADAVHPDALVNKVGTRALLETAERAGVPAFVLAVSSKLRDDAAPRVLGSLFESVPRAGIVVLTEKGRT